MKRILLFLSITLSSINGIVAFQPVEWPDGHQAALSLTFDDARLSHPDIGKDLFRALNARATFYVVPSGVRHRLEDWKEMVEDGHEIGNHTLYHPCTGNFSWSKDHALEEYTLASMRNELLQANLEIKELLDVLPVSFAYTCGNTFVGRGIHTHSYVPLIAELFESGRGWLNEAANDPTYVDFAQVQGIEMDGKDFERDIKPLVDQAIAQGSWLVLAGHEIGEPGVQTTHSQMLRELIAYVNRPEVPVWLTTVGEAAAHIKAQRTAYKQELKEHLTLYASFDQGTKADLARGDGLLYVAPSYDQTDQSIPGYLPPEFGLAQDKGRWGQALDFKRKGKPVLYYTAKDHLNYSTNDWEGTISLWLSLDPETDLAPGYTDPIQITDSGYDDAALWVDFSDKNPRDFRMGVFGDVDIWNPDKIGPDKNPAFNQRLVPAKDRPFFRNAWTHVAITFQSLNSDHGMATFYINGINQGSRDIPESFTWDPQQARIFLGLNYVGLLDEVAIFDRTLKAEEIQMLFQMPEPWHTP